MKPFLVLAMLYLAPWVRAEVDVVRLVEAIRMAENSPRAKIGRAGERSEYQITPAVWRQHSDWPIYMAGSPARDAIEEQQRVALAHVRWLERHVPCPTPYRLALAWNAGLGAVQRGGVSPGSLSYAQRVVNVYAELENRSQESEARSQESTVAVAQR